MGPAPYTPDSSDVAMVRPPNISTIHRILQRHDLVAPDEGGSSCTHRMIFGRSAAPRVALADGLKAWIVDNLDDHARYAISATAARSFTAHAAGRAMASRSTNTAHADS